jgi:choline dehydrogenase-like flavoprotein
VTQGFSVFGGTTPPNMDPLRKAGLLGRRSPQEPDATANYSDVAELISDHQFGTCRMGDDPRTYLVVPVHQRQ